MSERGHEWTDDGEEYRLEDGEVYLYFPLAEDKWQCQLYPEEYGGVCKVELAHLAAELDKAEKRWAVATEQAKENRTDWLDEVDGLTVLVTDAEAERDDARTELDKAREDNAILAKGLAENFDGILDEARAEIARLKAELVKAYRQMDP